MFANEIWPDVSVREPEAIFSVPVAQLLAARLAAVTVPEVAKAVLPKLRAPEESVICPACRASVESCALVAETFPEVTRWLFRKFAPRRR